MKTRHWGLFFSGAELAKLANLPEYVNMYDHKVCDDMDTKCWSQCTGLLNQVILVTSQLPDTRSVRVARSRWENCRSIISLHDHAIQFFESLTVAPKRKELTLQQIADPLWLSVVMTKHFNSLNYWRCPLSRRNLHFSKTEGWFEPPMARVSRVEVVKKPSAGQFREKRRISWMCT